MIQQELIKFVENFYADGVKLIKLKNNDYAEPDKNAFRNFDFSELVKVDRKRGVLVRISDKIARISNLLDKSDYLVKDESIRDTLIDGANYLALLAGMIEDDKKNQNINK